MAYEDPMDDLMDKAMEDADRRHQADEDGPGETRSWYAHYREALRGKGLAVVDMRVSE